MAEIYRQKPPTPRDKKKEPKSEKKPLTKYRQKVYDIIGESKTSISAFLARPKHLNFESQFDGEEVILLLRKHLVSQIRWVLIAVVMILAPLVLTNFPLIEFLPGRFQFIVILMWYLLVFAFVLENFLSWYFNAYIVTDERVIDIDFYNLIYKEISDAEIENIEDVTVQVGGVLQTVFNYGWVIIQTAARTPQFEFDYVPQPGKVSEVLKQLQLEEKQEELDGRIM